MLHLPLRSTRTDTHLPYTTLFRSVDFTVSTQMVPYQRVQVLGSKKRLEILVPFNAVAGEAMQLRLDDGESKGEGAGELFSVRSEEHTSELQSLMRISYAVSCLTIKIKTTSST